MSAPKYVQTLSKSRVAFSTANTARDGTGTLGTIVSGAATGSEVRGSIRLTVQSSAPAEDVVRLFADNGTNKTLLGEFYIPAIAPTSIRAGVQIDLPIPEENRSLPTTNDSLKISTHIGNSYQADSTRGDY